MPEIKMLSTDRPTVTVAIPVYNEERYIESVVFRFLESSYSNVLEILVADGGSTDETRNIVKRLTTIDARVKLIINPLKIQSAALNLMLGEARGDIFLRADAHCSYAPDYIEKCVEALLESRSVNVGGAQRFVASEAFQSGIALASRSALGSGGAKYRDPGYDGYGDTVFLGCFWKKALLELGADRSREEAIEESSAINFNPILKVYDTRATNEDAELNLRLKRDNPNAIYISSKIKVEYYPRRSPKALFIQYFKYGKGRYLTFIKYPRSTPLRSILPSLLIGAVFFTLLLDLLILNGQLYSRFFLAGILGLIFLEAFRVAYANKDNFRSEIWRGNSEKTPNFLVRVLGCYLALLIMPLAFFCGNLYQMIDHQYRKFKEILTKPS